MDDARVQGSESHAEAAALHHTNVATKDICIIGAGPSGLGSLKILLDHPLFKTGQWNVVVYEGRESLGGIWYVYSSFSQYTWKIEHS